MDKLDAEQCRGVSGAEAADIVGVHELSISRLERSADGVEDILTLRFEGKEKDGTTVQELRAAHVAEVLQGARWPIERLREGRRLRR